jgi:hypothetical protein
LHRKLTLPRQSCQCCMQAIPLKSKYQGAQQMMVNQVVFPSQWP